MTDDLVPTPIDPDTSRPRPQVLDPLIVFAGGMVGTAVRLVVSRSIPDLFGMPLAIFATNVSGALALGFLLEMLARRGPDLGRRRTARLVLGTGLLGGFTTFSTLAVGSAELLNQGRPFDAAAYSLGTVLVGAGGTAIGIALAKRIRSRHRESGK